jgi:polyisoprenyl-phosphate glycosyltransferase
MLISVIIPCFNEEKVLESTYQRVSAVLGKVQGTDYELLFVDDGSSDSTPAMLKSLAEKDPRLTFIRFSRNFGHQPAVSAGMQRCRGDLAVIIDADLQDPPEVIPDMLQQLKTEKANVAYGVRKRRKGETWFKLVTAKIFYLLLNKLSDVPIPLNTGDFRVVDRKVINAFNALPENTKYIRGLISWMGFKQIPYYYERDARFAGSTKYSLTKMIRFASTGIFYFSKKPLQLATAFGFLSVAAGLVLSAWILFNKFTNPQYLVSGWTSLALAVIYFGGVQLLTIGILGQYIGNLFDEVKRRPEYIVDEIITQQRAREKSSEMYFPLSIDPLVKEDQKLPETSLREKNYVTTVSAG